MYLSGGSVWRPEWITPLTVVITVDRNPRSTLGVGPWTELTLKVTVVVVTLRNRFLDRKGDHICICIFDPRNFRFEGTPRKHKLRELRFSFREYQLRLTTLNPLRGHGVNISSDPTVQKTRDLTPPSYIFRTVKGT